MSELAARLRGKIDDILHQRIAELATGNSPDFAGYQARCGYIRGLQDARLLITEALREMAELPQIEGLYE
jgi:hypothetical protein